MPSISSDHDRSEMNETPKGALKLIIPLIVAVAFMMEQLDATILTTALPRMAQSFGRSAVSLNLAITAYLISLAVFIPVSGWVADRFGMRRTFMAALAVFTIGSLLCAVAPGFWPLVGTRVLQGMGGAMMTPVGRLILLRSFPKRELVRAMTYFTVPVVVGPTLGPILGGLITTYLGWRWIFLVNLPIGMIGIAGAWYFLKEQRLERAPRFDARGFLMTGVAFVLLQLGIEVVGEGSHGLPLAGLFFAAAAAILVFYARYMRGNPHPALDLRLLRIPSFRHGVISGGISRMGLNAVPFLFPLMLQVGFGYSPLRAGFLTFIGSLGTVLIRPLAGRLLRRFGFGPLLAGNTVFAALGVAGFALIEAGTPAWAILAWGLLFGVGRGLQFTTLNTVSFVDTPPEKLSRSTAFSGVAQQLTMGFGIAVGAALLKLLGGPASAVSVETFHTVFLIMALVTLLSIPGFLRLGPETGAAVSGYSAKA
jgi:EmrB/QacA subfamily drug resistance transporter